MPWAISPIPWVAHEGQKKALKFLLNNACAGLFLSPGSGKSSVVLAAFKALKKKGLANKMLVVAPLRPCSLVWPPESRKWIDFKDLRVAVLHGKEKQKILDAGDFDIGVVNYEGLPWLLGAVSDPGFGGKRKGIRVNLQRFKAYGFDTLVLDELSKCKHQNTITVKSLRHVLPTFARRWGLTGSPAANGLQDLFSQIYCLDMGRSLGQYVTHFRNAFFNPHPSGFGFKIREGADKEIYARIKPLVLRFDAADFVTMPELINRRINFDLPQDVRKIYEEIEDDLISRMEVGDVVAANAAAASSKCRQIVNGGVYLEEDVDSDDNRRKWSNLHDCKGEILAEVLGELQGEPILVGYEFLHDLDRLLLRFGKNTPFIGGGVTPKRAEEIIDAWNRGEIPLLLGHPKSMGHGINAQGACSQVLWYSMPWDFEEYTQFIGRVFRQGQKAKHVYVHHLIASDTIDEAVWWALQRKDKTQNALFAALQQVKRRR